MFIEKNRRGYNRAGEQSAAGRFLLLLQPPGVDGAREPIRALVRHVRLRQCGHFMMGSAHAFGERLGVSGAYGSDGLPLSVSRAVYDRAVPVPADLVAAWNTGGGWNGAGSEAEAMRRWAAETFRPIPAGPRYSVTLFEPCAAGFERWRTEAEFLLVAHVDRRAGWRTMRDAWLADINACERPEGFDYAAARRLVCSYAAGLRRDWQGRPNPLRLPADPNGEGFPVRLYVRDNWHSEGEQ